MPTIEKSGMSRLAAQEGAELDELSEKPSTIDSPSSQSDEGSIEDIGLEAPGTEDTPDGGAIVTVDDAPTQRDTSDFYRNLIDELPIDVTSSLGMDLVDLIDQDIADRKPRDQQYAEGIQRTGIGNEAPGGAAFPGASKTVHPMLAKGCIDFAARTIREVLPSTGAVKDFIPGTPTKARLEKAKRKSNFMNWQLRKKMPEFRTELEQLFTQLPLGGSQYLVLIYDQVKKRPVPTFWPIDDVFIPSAASSFFSLDRLTLREYITQLEFDRRVKAEMYITSPGTAAASVMPPDKSESAKSSERIEGKTESVPNKDGLRAIYRCFALLELETLDELNDSASASNELQDRVLAPYILEIDATSHDVLSVVRNWEKGNENLDAMPWVVDFTFIPWRGALGIGLGQLIGSLAGSSTGAIRALLDSAHVNNLPTLLKLKGANLTGQTITLNATTINEVEGGPNADDIRKVMMAVPFNPPSLVLLQMIGLLTQEAEGVVRTTFEKLTDSSVDMPVGTTLALIEQGLKVLSAIHIRTYESLSRVFEILDRINRLYITDEEIKDELGELIAYKSDFQGPLDVIPVADPEIFSDVQRFAQIQMVASRADTHPDLYDRRKVEELILQRTKLPDAVSLLVPAPTIEEMNAVNENVAMALGRPVAAYPEQDHLGHLQILLDFLSSPVLGQSPLISRSYIPPAVAHAKEHIVMLYADLMVKKIENTSEMPIEEIMSARDPETRAELDKTLAAASPDTVQEIADLLSKAQPILLQAQEFVDQMAQSGMQDPTVAKATIDAQVKREALSVTQSANAAKKQTEDQKLAAKEKDRLSKEQIEREKIASAEKRNTDDNLTALSIASAEIEGSEDVSVSTGTGINP